MSIRQGFLNKQSGTWKSVTGFADKDMCEAIKAGVRIQVKTDSFLGFVTDWREMTEEEWRAEERRQSLANIKRTKAAVRLALDRNRAAIVAHQMRFGRDDV